MAVNLEIDFHGNGQMNQIFHPTLPFSYLKDRIYLGNSSGAPNEWTFNVRVQANRPFFYVTTGRNLGYINIRPGARGADGWYNVQIYVRRLIMMIDPRNGYITWNGAGQELIQDAYLVVGDIRG